jgi:hypothetical protein
MWVSYGSRTQEHKRDATLYPSLDYRGPTSSSEMFFIFKSTQIDGLEQRRKRFWKGIARCYTTSHQWWGFFPRVRDSALSLAGSGRQRLTPIERAGAVEPLYLLRPWTPGGSADARDIGCWPELSLGWCRARIRLGLPSIRSPGLLRAPKPWAMTMGVPVLYLTLSRGCTRAYPMGIGPEPMSDPEELVGHLSIESLSLLGT